MVKNPLASAGNTRDAGSIPVLGRSPGGGQSIPLQDSCLENPMDREAWRATVHGVTNNWTRLRPCAGKKQTIVVSIKSLALQLCRKKIPQRQKGVKQVKCLSGGKRTCGRTRRWTQRVTPSSRCLQSLTCSIFFQVSFVQLSGFAWL